MKIVNGFVCDCGSEERVAKRGIDPDNPHNDPVKAEELERKRGVTTEKPIEELEGGALDPKRRDENAAFDTAAVQFGGALSGVTQNNARSAPASPLLDVVA